MFINPINYIELSNADLKKLDRALTMLEEIFTGKIIEFTPELNMPVTKKIIAKKMYQRNKSTDGVALINFAEWIKKESVRKALGTSAGRLENIADKIIATNKSILKNCAASSNMF